MQHTFGYARVSATDQNLDTQLEVVLDLLGLDREQEKLKQVKSKGRIKYPSKKRSYSGGFCRVPKRPGNAGFRAVFLPPFFGELLLE